MSLLDSFIFLFKTDGAQNVKKDIDSINQSEKEQIKQTQNLSETFSQLGSRLVQIGVIYQTLQSRIAANEKMMNTVFLADSADIAVDALQQMGLAAEQYGGNMQTAANSVKSLNRNIQQFQQTGLGNLAQANLKYGLKISTDPQELMKNIAQAMQRLPKNKKLDLGKMLGLDEATIRLLSKGVKNFEEELQRASKYTWIDEGAIERSEKLYRVWHEFLSVVDSIWQSAVSSAAPALTWILEILRDIGTAFKGHSIAIAGLIFGIKNIGTALLTFNPMLAAIGAAGLAISLIVDDINSYLEDGDSYIKDLIDNSETFRNACVAVYQATEAIADGLRGAWEGAQQLWEDFKNACIWVDQLWESTKRWFDEWINNPIGAFFDGLKKIIGEVIDGLKTLGGWLGMDFGSNKLSSELNTMKTNIMSDLESPNFDFTPMNNLENALADMQRSGDITNDNSRNNNQTINIYNTFDVATGANFDQSAAESVTNNFADSILGNLATGTR